MTLGYFTQMLGLTVQNFVSAASGMAVLVALARGLARPHHPKGIGNFWVDLVRGTFYILLPLSFVLALLLVSQGVVQTFAHHQTAELWCNPRMTPKVRPVTQQVIAVGPAASQIAIKQLGTNGGGFFGVNSAHPFENPTPLSNFLEMLAILLIAAALTYTFGRIVNDQRQGWALLAAMTVLFVMVLALNVWVEQRGNPTLAARTASRRRQPDPSPAATWRARRSGSVQPHRLSGPPRPRRLPMDRSTRCTTPSCRWPGWEPCGSCSWARWCTAGWDRVCTA